MSSLEKCACLGVDIQYLSALDVTLNQIDARLLEPVQENDKRIKS